MRHYWLTIERTDGTWGRYDVKAADMQGAMRWVSRSIDLDTTRNLHLVEFDPETNEAKG